MKKVILIVQVWCGDTCADAACEIELADEFEMERLIDAGQRGVASLLEVLAPQIVRSTQK